MVVWLPTVERHGRAGFAFGARTLGWFGEALGFQHDSNHAGLLKGLRPRLAGTIAGAFDG